MLASVDLTMGNNGTPPFLPIAPAAAHETWRAKKPTSGRPKIGTMIGAQFTSFNFLDRLSCPVVSSGFGRNSPSVVRHENAYCAAENLYLTVYRY